MRKGSEEMYVILHHKLHIHMCVVIYVDSVKLVFLLNHVFDSPKFMKKQLRLNNAFRNCSFRFSLVKRNYSLIIYINNNGVF